MAKQAGESGITLTELSQVYFMHREVAEIEHMLERADGADGTAALKVQLKTYKLKLEREREKLIRYIRTIPDSQTRLVFIMRFERCLSWRQIANYIGGNNTEESVKKICYRYIKESKKTR